ncbi:MAG: aminotransferase class I/II-fold pyridoxal phosphate-dependent enzyme [Nitrosopumilus sp.]|nr:aminotransferase class I/II-fold pyridoxal phosphate-dependent enzyme [Nitrosopumilus sp.]MDF2422586.1 aminotransferase class I/II-fold pyridoxal phosphate-dependent enzyme [Nitrosopumilus sp.]MDF2423820.1 aminotransferase class I/II-fold pyridoxal phosphate-dependent enzyme [Nitrosopumilus sp.]MDF2425781.1 aminotransferase class I/II-fold pyridoxal phosphate-dependent enzyme [Nitrosopumilus sp.]MDF2426489.1 aminotransferase class I/II-fold pyridoxal phosphate-dependent enzyme [Nitrosopumilu
MTSKHKLNFVDYELTNLKQNNLYRKLRYGIAKGSEITINNKRLVNLCSNDYLGIPTTKIQIKQLQSSSRLVSGNDESYKKLEDALAKHKSHQNSLIYPTGYMANLGAISAIAKKGDLILSDELNHASIIESCKLAGAKISIYKHNDMDDLSKKIKRKGKNKFVITEGVFSMDGDLSPLKEIAYISEKSNAITIVDDAHGDFVIGDDGKGTPDHFKVAKKIDLYVSSLSKGLGSFGGYVSSHNNVIDLCINKSKSFIYTSALPSFLVEYSFKRFQSNREKQKRRLVKNTEQLAKGLEQSGYEINSATQIIPIIIGNEKKAMEFGKFLFDNGVFAQPIRYPTVPKDQARLRISVTAWLSGTDIEKTLEIFDKARGKFL